ncbi:MAG: response regulator [Planctomycetes bacterium]|nr:response regulator [Planctomycetota bacterium]
MARLLVVEDDPAVRHFLHLMGRRAGHEVEVALDGHHGFQQAVTGRYDLVITDLMMPEWDGVTFIRSLGIVAPQTRILVLSAYINESVYESIAFESNVVAVLGKPFSPVELEGLISANVCCTREG